MDLKVALCICLIGTLSWLNYRNGFDEICHEDNSNFVEESKLLFIAVTDIHTSGDAGKG